MLHFQKKQRLHVIISRKKVIDLGFGNNCQIDLHNNRDLSSSPLPLLAMNIDESAMMETPASLIPTCCTLTWSNATLQHNYPKNIIVLETLGLFKFFIIEAEGGNDVF